MAVCLWRGYLISMFNKVKNNKAFLWGIIGFIIIMQLCYITYVFQYKKDDFHSDEMWTYGLSNSYYQPHVALSDDGLESDNVNEWLSSDIFKNYLTVDNEHRFSFDSVYYNQVNDLNPPLQYMIVNAICSLFPGTYSKWFAYFVNVIAFIFTQIFLYKTVKSLTNSKWMGIIAIAFFGFTIGAVNTFMFLRLYALATMFTMMFVYYTCMVFKHKDDLKKNILIKLFISTLCGALTVHLFLVMAFMLTACMCVYFLITKRFKTLFKYAGTVLGATVLSIIIFPATIEHLIGDKCYKANFKYSFRMQLRICFAFVFNELIGIKNSFYENMTLYYIVLAIGIILFMAIPMCFVFRNEQWFKNIKNKVVTQIKAIIENKNNWHYDVFALFIAAIFHILIVAKIIAINHMGNCTDRYLFIIFPVAIVIFSYILYRVSGTILKKRIVQRCVIVAICMVFMVTNHIMGTYNYLFTRNPEGVTLEEISNDSDFVLLLSQYWLATCYSYRMLDSNECFITSYDDLLKQENSLNTYKTQDSNRKLYLIMDVSVFKQSYLEDNIDDAVVIDNQFKPEKKYEEKEVYLKFLEELKITKNLEYIGNDTSFGRKFEIYRWN